MKVAIPLWRGRISPVFDEAGRILIADVCNRMILNRRNVSLTIRGSFRRAQFLSELEVELLVCGMITHAQSTALESTGIRVIPHICGDIEEVMNAIIDGGIEKGTLLMPGCRSRRSFRC